MQATISAFDEPSHTGRVLLDDGYELSFDASAFAASRMLTARLGQRVELTVTTQGADKGADQGADHRAPQHVTALRLITFR